MASIVYKPVRDDRARAHVWQDALCTLLEPFCCLREKNLEVNTRGSDGWCNYTEIDEEIQGIERGMGEGLL